jgi:hypothetical protein
MRTAGVKMAKSPKLFQIAPKCGNHSQIDSNLFWGLADSKYLFKFMHFLKSILLNFEA